MHLEFAGKDGEKMQLDVPGDAVLKLARADGAADPAALTDMSGWGVFELAPRSRTESPCPIPIVDPQTSKLLVLVKQRTSLLRVYANPKFNEPDVWEVPGSFKMSVLSPQAAAALKVQM